MRKPLALALLALLAGCLDPGVDAPADQPAAEGGAAAAQDFAADVDEDLLTAGFDQTFEFDYAEGAHGGFTVGLRTRMQGLVQPEACVAWTRTFPGGETSGQVGECSQGPNVSVAVVVFGGDLTTGERQWLHWDGDDLAPGHYAVHVTAPAQANRIWVAGAIDNPPFGPEA